MIEALYKRKVHQVGDVWATLACFHPGGYYGEKLIISQIGFMPGVGKVIHYITPSGHQFYKLITVFRQYCRPVDEPDAQIGDC